LASQYELDETVAAIRCDVDDPPKKSIGGLPLQGFRHFPNYSPIEWFQMIRMIAP
jgi:hypothetical protein